MAKNDGFEPVDNRPVALPVGYVKQPEADRLKGLMERLFVDMRTQNEADSFEDSLDFDVDEDDPISPSEMRYMVEERVLTEAEEAATVVRHRLDAKSFKDKYHGKRDSDQGRKGAGSDGTEVAGRQRNATGEQSA